MATSGKVPTQVGLEYSRGTGAFFPGYTTQATVSGLQSAVTSVNGQTVAGVTIAADNSVSSGATIKVTAPATGTIGIGVVVGIVVGAGKPANPTTGMLAYDTTAGHLYVWGGSSWLPA